MNKMYLCFHGKGTKKHWARFLFGPGVQIMMITAQQEYLQWIIDKLRGKIIELQGKYKEAEKELEILIEQDWSKEEIQQAKQDAMLFRTNQKAKNERAQKN